MEAIRLEIGKSTCCVYIEHALRTGSSQVYVTVTVANDITLLSQIFDMASTQLEPLKSKPGLRYAMAYQAIPTSVTSQSLNNGGNALGLNLKDGNLVLIFLDISWKKSEDDNIMNRQAASFLEQVETLAAGLGRLHRWKYLNYAAKWQDPMTGYGHENREKLRAASRKYDPDQVFQKQVPGGYKLF